MDILTLDNIITGLAPEPHEDIIRRCGAMLVASGYVEPGYVEGMIARDRGFSTAIGNLIAIPHGEAAYREMIKQTGLVVLTYPQGVAWGEESVKLVIGIAAKGEEHMEVLERIVNVFEEEADVERAVAAGDARALWSALTQEQTQ